MYPWLWLWAPQTHFPLSGSVAQRIEPKTFFDAIPPSVGDGRVERRAFDEVASYGRQIGLLTEALLDLAERGAPASTEGATAIHRLREIRQAVKRIKDEEATASAERIEAWFRTLGKRDPAACAALIERLRKVTAESG